MPSKKQTKSATVTPAAAAAPKRWTVELHREVAKDVVDYGLVCPDFMPIWDSLLGQLESNPKQFPKKSGKLQKVRAAPLKYRNVAHRVVFTLNEEQRKVYVLACDPHDEAYAKATRRIKTAKARYG